jgi:uncharacterized membrane protein
LGHDEPNQLGMHLIRQHEYEEAKAWFVAGQENERLYPRYRAPKGMFTVLAVDLAHSRGEVVDHCKTPEQAIHLAYKIAARYQSVLVYDDAGNQFFTIGDTRVPRPSN